MNTAFWKKPLPESAVVLFFLSIYIAAAVFLSAHHEVWRDEARALGVIIESRTPAEMVSGLANEGHPLLWHFILFAAWNLFHSPWVLKAANLAISAAAAFWILRRAPFPWPARVLFVFGYFPLIEYGIVSRNYAMGLLALVLAADAWRLRFSRPALFGAALFFLSNTHANCLILAGALAAAWGLEAAFTPGSRPRPRLLPLAAGFILAAGGMALSIAQILPDRSTEMTPIYTMSLWSVLPGFLDALFAGGIAFSKAFGFDTAYVSLMAVWLGYLAFYRRPWILAAYFFGVVGMALFFQFIYAGYLRHQGFIVMYLLAIFWMDRADREATAREEKGFAAFKRGYLYAVLALQFTMTAAAVPSVLRDEFSSSRRLAEFVRARPDLERAVFVAEPDYYAEPMSYYFPDNPIYLAREGRFGRKVNFTTKNARRLTLRRLLAEGNRIRRRTGRPVIFLIGHTLSPDGGHYAYGRKSSFRYTKRSLELFLRHAPRAASMHAAFWENFDVYVLGAPVDAAPPGRL